MSEKRRDGEINPGGTKKRAKKKVESTDGDEKIYWTDEMEEFLLENFRQQKNLTGNSKTIKAKSWNKICELMKGKFEGVLFTKDKCRNKFNILKGQYQAYKLYMDASGFGEDNDDEVWDALITKNPKVAAFRDGEAFVHYEKMFDIVGESIFQGKHMVGVGNMMDDDDDESSEEDADNEEGEGVSQRDDERTPARREVALLTTPSTGNSTTASQQDNIRGVRGGGALQAAMVIENKMSEFGGHFTVAMGGIATALSAVGREETSKSDKRSEALEFFKEGKRLSHLYQNREDRKKIQCFFSSRENAEYFLLQDDVYKGEYVEDVILGRV